MEATFLDFCCISIYNLLQNVPVSGFPSQSWYIMSFSLDWDQFCIISPINSSINFYSVQVHVNHMWKIDSNSLSKNSTIWFWKTMYVAMFADSTSGLSNVGPKTIATFCTVILFSSPCWMTLKKTERHAVDTYCSIYKNI